MTEKRSVIRDRTIDIYNDWISDEHTAFVDSSVETDSMKNETIELSPRNG